MITTADGRLAGYAPSTPALKYLQDLIAERDWSGTNLKERVDRLVDLIKAGRLDAAVCSRAIDALKELPRKPAPDVATLPKVAPGYYALGDEDRPERYRVKEARSGRTYVDHIGPNEATTWLRYGEMVPVLTEIAKDERAAALLYATVTDRCARCNRYLTEPVSVSAGYGPDCRKALGIVA